jgi:hypothetical protein
MALSIDRHYAECCYVSCRDYLHVMLSAVTLSVVMLSVVMLSVIMLSVIMLSVVMLRDVASILNPCTIIKYMQCPSNAYLLSLA